MEARVVINGWYEKFFNMSDFVDVSAIVRQIFISGASSKTAVAYALIDNIEVSTKEYSMVIDFEDPSTSSLIYYEYLDDDNSFTGSEKIEFINVTPVSLPLSTVSTYTTMEITETFTETFTSLITGRTTLDTLTPCSTINSDNMSFPSSSVSSYSTGAYSSEVTESSIETQYSTGRGTSHFQVFLSSLLIILLLYVLYYAIARSRA